MDNATESKRPFVSINEKAREALVPTDATFELTPRCTLSCKFCYIHLTPEQMKPLGRERTAEEWIDMGRQAAEAGAFNLLLTGGEAMIRPDFPRIYKELCEMGYRVTLYSNATLIDEKMVALFGEYPPVCLGVTVYGASEETYKRICGCEGFNKVIGNIDRLHASVPTIPIEFKTNYVHGNEHDFDALKKLADDRGFPFRVSFATFKGIRGTVSKCESCRFDLHEMKNFQKEHCPELLEEENEKAYESGEMTCDAASTGFGISWDGRMLPCISFSSPYTLPFEQGFTSAWSELTERIKHVTVPNRCLKCEYRAYCGSCPALVQIESGTYAEAPARCVRYLQPVANSGK